jgi:predicted porin
VQKKLIGIAVAAALAPAAAFAQPAGTGVQIYGLIDFSANHNKFDDATGGGGDVSKGEFYSSASRLGLRGREALGTGLTAWFQAEIGVQPFRPDPNAPSNGNNMFGGRDTGLGLEGPWGTLMGGTWGSPYKVANLATWNLGTYGLVSHYGMIMNNGDSTGTEPSPNCASPGATALAAAPATTICGNGVMTEGSTTAFGRRLSNTVQYWTPTIGGFQARIATQLTGHKSPSGFATGTDPSLWAASVAWTGGPFSLGAAYERHDEFRSTGVAGSPDPTDTAWMIGGKWTSGPFSIGAAYEMTEYEDSGPGDNFEKKNYVINGAFRIASGEIFAGYSWTKGAEDCGAGAAGLCGDATKAKFFSAGYAHNLSKRTKAYVQFATIDNDLASAVYYIAAFPGNASGGTGGLIAGTDVRTIGVGVQHAF